ncbi:Hypothetical Protein FCC1311_089962 [Hondaea fermentalgiana]|uniref:Nascent polypeptide-associated complex subunit alpha-like UBA domain-containing protein n=1 Tax=Hondaea fermentalgiana TaxID=2315210 RepID=A0A2R5GWI6_9STRA|nr:Hypothetical Protein FCC1311_089962 [Hondaea fermentalgiana]|eukprot:GBG32771.1 Hypothetical Protein FCC1311_089962 [Hondaea fermentalgiana]
MAKDSSAMERMNEGEEAAASGANASGQTIQEALQELAVAETKAKEEELAREKELAKVEVKDADVDLVVKEFEMEKTQALRALREAGGDLQKALATLVLPQASTA